jgi:hypothetical protein
MEADNQADSDVQENETGTVQILSMGFTVKVAEDVAAAAADLPTKTDAPAVSQEENTKAEDEANEASSSENNFPRFRMFVRDGISYVEIRKKESSEEKNTTDDTKDEKKDETKDEK